MKANIIPGIMNTWRSKKWLRCEATEPVAGVHELLQILADKRNPHCLPRRNVDGPHCVLIPAHELAGEAHPQGKHQEHDPRKPIALAGKFEAA